MLDKTEPRSAAVNIRRAPTSDDLRDEIDETLGMIGLKAERARDHLRKGEEEAFELSLEALCHYLANLFSAVDALKEPWHGS